MSFVYDWQAVDVFAHIALKMRHFDHAAEIALDNRHRPPSIMNHAHNEPSRVVPQNPVGIRSDAFLVPDDESCRRFALTGSLRPCGKCSCRSGCAPCDDVLL